MMRLIPALVLAVFCGCSGSQVGKRVHQDPMDRGEPGGIAAQGSVGVEHQALGQLLDEHWQWTLRHSPVWATTLGDHRFDSEITDNSERGIDLRRAGRRVFLTKAKAMSRDGMGAKDEMTLRLFEHALTTSIESEVCEIEQWSISARGNPLTEWNVLPEMHKAGSLNDAENLLARYRKIPQHIDNSVANLRRGIKNSLVANGESVRRTLEMLETQLAQPVAEWALMKPADSLPGDWPAADRERLAGELRSAVANQIKPALERYRLFLKNEIMPVARSASEEGVGALPSGPDCYEARIFHYTGLHLPSQSLHRLGRSELERINAEMEALGEKLFGQRSLADIIERLRAAELHYDNADEIVAKATSALAAAKKKMPDYFGIVPAADCVVVPIPAYEAPYTTIAYYRQPHADGSKPGEYFINTYKPEVRPRYEMEVLAYHEAIPGHHLQIAISQERSALPAFRRFGGSTAFVEGWALYTERLADEMGLYSTDLDRMGMLSYDAWRAARLVVDTGIHALGWTRGQAETFMREHTALTDDNIRNEVDRYITWPGQALAYKVGQRSIFELREAAKKELGARFDIKKFHDVVLENGAVSLPVLRSVVHGWIDAEKK